VAQYDLPLLSLVNNVSPVLGVIMSIILFGMIFNTGLGMFYGFATRLFELGTNQFIVGSAITLMVGFIAGFVGFTDLVSTLVVAIGYLGVFLFIALLCAAIRLKKLGINKRSE